MQAAVAHDIIRGVAASGSGWELDRVVARTPDDWEVHLANYDQGGYLIAREPVDLLQAADLSGICGCCGRAALCDCSVSALPIAEVQSA